MWPSRRGLCGQRNRGRGGEGPDVFCESLFFQIKMASAVKRSRMVALSAERVLESLEQKSDGNAGISSGEESDLYRQLQHTRNRSRYKLSCVTVLLRKHTLMNAFQIILLSSSGH